MKTYIFDKFQKNDKNQKVREKKIRNEYFEDFYFYQNLVQHLNLNSDFHFKIKNKGKQLFKIKVRKIDRTWNLYSKLRA